MFNSFRLVLSLVAVAAVAASGCGLDKQTAPALAGPSELTQAITLAATPDHLLQDGESQTVVTAVVRNESGQPVPGIGVRFSVVVVNESGVPTQTFVQAADQAVVTGPDGRATTTITAPIRPAVIPSSPEFLRVTATPIGSALQNAVPRTIDVTLVPPHDTPPGNNNPIAVIVAQPRVANINETISFDASQTTDEGQPCGTRCSYVWEFGDNTIDRGINVTHAYALPGVYTVRLTVADDRGGLGTTTVTVTIIGPAAPVATLTVTPASPRVNTVATFSGTASTVGAGATIEQYLFDFGDGTPVVQGTSPTATHTYAAAGSFASRLTITDSLGRTSTATATVTVVP